MRRGSSTASSFFIEVVLPLCPEDNQYSRTSAPRLPFPSYDILPADMDCDDAHREEWSLYGFSFFPSQYCNDELQLGHLHILEDCRRYIPEQQLCSYILNLLYLAFFSASFSNRRRDLQVFLTDPFQGWQRKV